MIVKNHKTPENHAVQSRLKKKSGGIYGKKRKCDSSSKIYQVGRATIYRWLGRAKKFGLHPSAIFYALTRMKNTRKKKNSVTKKERRAYQVLQNVERANRPVAI